MKRKEKHKIKIFKIIIIDPIINCDKHRYKQTLTLTLQL